MEPSRKRVELPPIPAKRYFTIGEVSDLCGVKPHVLRYWEQEFTQLKPVKRRGNRRYYQHHEVLMIRRIRDDGVTVVLVEQNVVQSLAIADRAYVLEFGAIMLCLGLAIERLSRGYLLSIR